MTRPPFLSSVGVVLSLVALLLAVVFVAINKLDYPTGGLIILLSLARLF